MDNKITLSWPIRGRTCLLYLQSCTRRQKNRKNTIVFLYNGLHMEYRRLQQELRNINQLTPRSLLQGRFTWGWFKSCISLSFMCKYIKIKQKKLPCRPTRLKDKCDTSVTRVWRWWWRWGRWFGVSGASSGHLHSDHTWKRRNVLPLFTSDQNTESVPSCRYKCAVGCDHCKVWEQFLLQVMKTNHCVKPLLMSSWVKSTRTWRRRREKNNAGSAEHRLKWLIRLLFQTELYLSQKAFVFGEQTSTVLHGHI